MSLNNLTAKKVVRNRNEKIFRMSLVHYKYSFEQIWLYCTTVGTAQACVLHRTLAMSNVASV